VQRARRLARAVGLQYVYTGNVHDAQGGSTWCPSCGALLIERDWFTLGRWGLDGDGCCRACGHAVPGRFEAAPGVWGASRQPVRLQSAAP
jgi:pyruvate formate lyase activating enzyme